VVAESKTTPSALWVGLGVNSFGLILGILIFSLDRNFRRRPRPTVVDGNDDSLTEPLLPGNLTETEVPDSTALEASSTPGAGKITRMSSLFWLLSLSCLVVYGCVLPFNNVASAILLERNYFKTPPDDCQLLYPNECTSGTLQDHLNPSTDSNGQSCPGPHYAPVLPTTLNITRIGHAYHKVSLPHVEVDCEVSFWSHGCTRDYCEASDRASLTADRVMSIPYIVSAIVSPVLGGIVDKVGKRALLAFLAPLVLIVVHMTLALSDASPILPLLGQGLSYALFGAVLWPSVPLTVEPSLAGTAFGIINSIQNIGLAVFPLVVAEIHNQAGQYLPHVEYFFCACAFMGVLVGIWLNLIDRMQGNKLNSVDGKGDVEESPSPATGAVEELNASEIV
jgi:predicted outer membrane lipoprotein